MRDFFLFSFDSKLFKLEKFSECVDLYRTLIKTNPDGDQSTRQANYIAALAMLKLAEPSTKYQIVKNER